MVGVSMAKKEIIGLMVCPECGLEGAEVKRQKNGLLYRYCPDCDAQYFPRTQAASDLLAAKLKKPEAEAAKKPDEGGDGREVAERPAEREKPRRQGFDFGLGV